MRNIAENIEIVHQKILDATVHAGRNAGSVRLIAVSKGKSEADVRTAIAAGQRVFGENRVQEAAAKFRDLRTESGAGAGKLELHLIGPLQTNKAEDALQIFDVIQTLDRPKLAEALTKAMKKIARIPEFYIEVNIGGEPQKAGVTSDELPTFLKFCREDCGLKISGLMCIPPQAENPAPHFLKLKELAERFGLERLSMGMSGDFEEAVRCGATEVRVGTAIFGKRG